MRAVEVMLGDGMMSLRKAMEYSGCSRKMYYYKPTQRILEPDPFIVEKTKEIALERPSYGTRRMGAMLERELRVPINRKRVQRIFRALNWINPSMKKKEGDNQIHSEESRAHKTIRALGDRPNLCLVWSR
jgi:hypothetical protein